MARVSDPHDHPEALTDQLSESQDVLDAGDAGTTTTPAGQLIGKFLQKDG